MGKLKPDPEERKRRRPVAFDFEGDGKHLRVEFTRDNGERVSGLYQLVGWGQAPAAEAAEVQRRLNMIPQTVLRSGATAQKRVRQAPAGQSFPPPVQP